MTNYSKGRKKEYEIMHQLEREGWTVLRTAGSHGFADLIAINKKERKIRFIQCKPDDFSKAAGEDLMKEHEEFNHHIWTSTFEVI